MSNLDEMKNAFSKKLSRDWRNDEKVFLPSQEGVAFE